MTARLVVCISGSGSNLQAIINAIADGTLAARITRVVSNRKAAYGLVRAEQAGIPTCYRPLRAYRQAGKTRQAYDADLAADIAAEAPDLIVLAGWMHIFGATFLDRFPGRVINLHPALPGQFAGTNAIARAFAAYQQGRLNESGCMVHYVVPEVDAGPVIATSRVPFQPGDTLDAFEERMHAAEHQLIVVAIQRALNNPAPS